MPGSAPGFNQPVVLIMPRLFFALWPDTEVRQQFASISEQMPAKYGRHVSACNLHITLVFLGNIDEKEKECMLASVSQIKCTPVNLYLDQLGWWKKTQVVWLAPSSIPVELESLAGELAGVATRCGIRVDERPYRPHMTLLRKVRKNPHLPAITPVPWAIRKFSLLQSINTPDGVKYEPVWTSP